MAHRKTLFRVLLALTSALVSVIAAEVGLRSYEALQASRTGDLRQQLERSRQTPFGKAGRRGRFVLRGLVQPSSSPEVVYELKPGLEGTFKNGFFRTNSWGFRGEEVEIEKPPGTFRIVGIGDSFMFGWGVDQHETYLAGLERVLNSRGGSHTQALNLAVPGYNTAIEVASLAAKGLAFEPDLVVNHFFHNDLFWPGFLQDPKQFLSAKRGLYLVDLLRNALKLSPAAEVGQRTLMPYQRVQRYPEGKDELLEAYRHMVGESGYRQAMARLAGLTRERSIPVVVILLEGDDPTSDLVREVVASEGLHLLELRRSFLAYLGANQKDPSEWAETFHVSDRDPHLNRLGHSLIADALLEFLTQRELVRLPPVSDARTPTPEYPEATESGRGRLFDRLAADLG